MKRDIRTLEQGQALVRAIEALETIGPVLEQSGALGQA